jgi:hypothetical protein
LNRLLPIPGTGDTQKSSSSTDDRSGGRKGGVGSAKQKHETVHKKSFSFFVFTVAGKIRPKHPYPDDGLTSTTSCQARYSSLGSSRTIQDFTFLSHHCGNGLSQSVRHWCSVDEFNSEKKLGFGS